MVLTGMGGSSLFPEVLATTFGSAEGYPTCTCSTPPTRPPSPRSLDACPADRTFWWRRRSRARRSRPARTSSCSGRARATRPASPSSPTPVPLSATWPASAGSATCGRTTPTSAAATRRCRCSASCRPRCSASTAPRCSTPPTRWPTASQPVDDDDRSAPGVALGAAIGAAALAGRDKLTILLDPAVATFGLWLEQLVAESLGKHGVGAVPDRRRAVRHRAGPSRRPADRRSSATPSGAAEVRASGQSRRSSSRWRSRPTSAPTSCCGSSPSRSPAGCSASTPSTSPTSRRPRSAARACSTPTRRRARRDAGGRGAGHGAARRLPGHLRLRRSRTRSRRHGWSTPRSRSVVASAWRPRSASARGSCTRPASSTRAARTTRCSSRWWATDPADLRHPRPAVHLRRVQGTPRPPATCRPCATPARTRAYRVDLDDPAGRLTTWDSPAGQARRHDEATVSVRRVGAGDVTTSSRRAAGRRRSTPPTATVPGRGSGPTRGEGCTMIRLSGVNAPRSEPSTKPVDVGGGHA